MGGFVCSSFNAFDMKYNVYIIQFVSDRFA